MKRLTLALLLAFAALLAFAGGATQARSAAAQPAPDDPCAFASDLGPLADMPLTAEGRLTGIASYPLPGGDDPSSDIYRLTTTVGTLLRVELAAQDGGTLPGAQLAVLNLDEAGRCRAVYAWYVAQPGSPAFITVPAPADEVYVAVMSFAGYPPVSDGTVDYSLSISRAPTLGPVTGRLVDPDGNPVSPQTVGWLYVQLNYCPDEYNCWIATSGSVNPDGTFMIAVSDTLGPAEYTLTVAADGYTPYASERFALALDTPKELGTIVLNRVARIAGRVVDAETGQPPSSYGPISVELLRCDAGGCVFHAYTNLDYDGRFSFDSSPYGLSLEPGDYRIDITSSEYEPLTIGPFTLASGEQKAFDTLSLTPRPLIAGVTGRVLDAETRQPPPVGAVTVELQRCLSGWCSDTVAFVPVGADGRFSISAENAWRRLTVGDYRVVVRGAGYRATYSPRFTAGAGDQYRLATIQLQPRTVVWGASWICSTVPAGRERCEYGADLTSVYNRTVQVRVWSLVSVWTDYGEASSAFQPTPAQLVQLRPGATKAVKFALDIPSAMPEGATMCATLYAAPDGKGYQFNPVANTEYGMCLTKQTDGSLRKLTPAEVRQLERARGGTGARP